MIFFSRPHPFIRAFGDSVICFFFIFIFLAFWLLLIVSYSHFYIDAPHCVESSSIIERRKTPPSVSLSPLPPCSSFPAHEKEKNKTIYCIYILYITLEQQLFGRLLYIYSDKCHHLLCFRHMS